MFINYKDNCKDWKLHKLWTLKWMIDMGYEKGDCPACCYFEQCKKYYEYMKEVKKDASKITNR